MTLCPRSTLTLCPRPPTNNPDNPDKPNKPRLSTVAFAFHPYCLPSVRPRLHPDLEITQICFTRTARGPHGSSRGLPAADASVVLSLSPSRHRYLPSDFAAHDSSRTD